MTQRMTRPKQVGVSKKLNVMTSAKNQKDTSQHHLTVQGDVKIQFYEKDQASGKMFHIWFNTGFIENNYLCFDKSVIDKACKDKENKAFDSNFKIEIFLQKV